MVYTDPLINAMAHNALFMGSCGKASDNPSTPEEFVQQAIKTECQVNFAVSPPPLHMRRTQTKNMAAVYIGSTSSVTSGNSPTTPTTPLTPRTFMRKCLEGILEEEETEQI